MVRIRYKTYSPEKPFSNVFNSTWTLFTSIQKVSFHQYNIDWESEKRPRTLYLFFVWQVLCKITRQRPEPMGSGAGVGAGSRRRKPVAGAGSR